VATAQGSTALNVGGGWWQWGVAIAKAMERVGEDGVKVVEKEEEELEEEENHGGCNFPKRCTFPLTKQNTWTPTVEQYRRDEKCDLKWGVKVVS
jgi:hypothetical protein